jgi:iron complex outermembrane receptor protein
VTLRIDLPRAACAAFAVVCSVLFNPAVAQDASRAAHAADSESLQEIIVTATKRQESVQQIPLSVTAITGQMLEEKSAQNFSDYARGVPNLSFIDVGDGRERIAIRGIDSKTGTTTVGYYFDETPIPDSSSVSAVKVAFDPDLIDVNRVEVLRGPQGTVFGSGSMGGTIRVIPNGPDVSQFDYSVKDRLSSTEHANGPSETFSGMLNIPLIGDTLAVRLVAWGKWDSGFIERQVATPDSHAANIASGAPVDFEPVGRVPSSESFGTRIALKYQANAALALEASIFVDDQFYRGFQDITTGAQNPNDALVQNFLFNLNEENRNRLSIGNLKATADFGWSDLLVSASYTRRLLSLKEESAAALEFVGFAPAFDAAPITEEGRDDAVTVEARLASSRSGAHANDPLQWLLGAYYTYQKGWTVIPWTVPGFTDHFGDLTGPVDGDNLYNTTSIAWIRQKAVFGELSYSPVERLKLTVGSRWFDYSRVDSDPQNGIFAGVNSAAPLDPYNSPMVRGTANSAVYKGAVSWQQSKNLMLYAQASEGFRGPFGRAALPDTCASEAQQLGAGIGQGQVGADKLWNYEGGIKSDWLSNRLRINVSGYRINWTNVQQAIFLDCGFDLVENLGSVRTEGGELEVEGRVTDALFAGTSVGYLHSALQQDIYGIPGTKGQPLPDVPQMSVGAFLEYNLPDFGGWHAAARTDYSYSDHTLSAYGVGQSFTPDKKAISLINARFSLQRDNLELALFAQNLLNDVERTDLERDVSLNVDSRLRYSVNTPRTFGISFSYRK